MGQLQQLRQGQRRNRRSEEAKQAAQQYADLARTAIANDVVVVDGHKGVDFSLGVVDETMRKASAVDAVGDDPPLMIKVVRRKEQAALGSWKGPDGAVLFTAGRRQCVCEVPAPCRRDFIVAVRVSDASANRVGPRLPRPQGDEGSLFAAPHDGCMVCRRHPLRRTHSRRGLNICRQRRAGCARMLVASTNDQDILRVCISICVSFCFVLAHHEPTP